MNTTFLAKTFYNVKPDERKMFEYERSPFMSVSLPALNYQATERISTLSKPKVRQETTIRDGFSRYISNPTYSGVTKAATKAHCSSRVSELSGPVKRSVEYKYELPLPRRVPHGALKYVATERITELATPKKLPGVR